MHNQLSYLESLADFNLVRFEPNDIILMNKRSRQAFRYYELNQQINLLPEVGHPYLQRPILYNNAVIYPKGDSTLANQLDTRIRAYDPIHYSNQEICNTFSPVIECIEYLQKQGIVHGTLSTESILFFENGNILLKDWIFKSSNQSLYHAGEGGQLSKSDDVKALGKIVAQASCLKSMEQIQQMSTQEIIETLLSKYQVSFCYGLIILLQGLYKHLHMVLSLMSNSQKSIKDEQVINIFHKAQKLKLQKQREAQRKLQQQLLLKTKLQNEKEREVPKIVLIPKKQPITESKAPNIANISSLQGSPTKKFNINANKKLLKLDDGENKKNFNEDVKKKQIQKITKIIERSNAFVNELMARKNNEKKLLQGSKANNIHVPNHNTSMYDSFGIENTSKKVYGKQSPKRASPSKRLRSISKKK